MNYFNGFEIGILDFIKEHLGCMLLDKIMPLVTMLGDAGVFWILIAVTMLFFRSTRKTGITMGLALIMGLLVGNLTLKPLVARIRPYDVNEGVELLISKLHDFSFPSGHTLASFEAAGVLMIRERRRFGYPALALAIIIAFSRLYLYVHYPTDVAAGIILGLAFAFLSYLIINAIFRKYFPKFDKSIAPTATEV